MGESALFFASENGLRKIVELLLQHGVEVNQQTENGWFPLIIASESGHGEVVKMLLEKVAQVNLDIYNGNSCKSKWPQKMVLWQVFKKNKGDDSKPESEWPL